MEHLDVQKFFPSGGWALEWVADPNRGYGARQPGSWQFSTLAFLEDTALRDLAEGAVGGQLYQAIEKMVATPIATFYCPSRRQATVYDNWTQYGNVRNCPTINRVKFVAKSDYAANSGDSRYNAGDNYSITPNDYAQADSGFVWSDTENSRNSLYQSGVMHYRSEIGERRISDGLTKTYLVGEKYLNSQLYEKPWFGTNLNTADWGDNQSVFAGFEMDNHRLTKYLDSGGNEFDAYPPRRDHPQISNFRAPWVAPPPRWVARRDV